jgi:hypothetical protein
MADDEHNTDPWKRAQEGPFAISATGSSKPPPVAPQSPAQPPPASGPKPGGRFGSTAAALLLAVLLVLVVGGIVAAVYFYVRSAGRAATTGLSVAERAQVEVTLNDASKTELAYLSENNYFTDDVDVLKSRLPNLAWEQGSNPQRTGVVYVEVCDSNGTSVLLQLKTGRGNVFAMWLSADSSVPYYFAGSSVSCPIVDDRGVPQSPWTPVQEDAWGGTAVGGAEGPAPVEVPPPAGGPRPPTIPSPYGGTTSTPYGGSGGGSGSKGYEPYP